MGGEERKTWVYIPLEVTFGVTIGFALIPVNVWCVVPYMRSWSHRCVFAFRGRICYASTET